MKNLFRFLMAYVLTLGLPAMANSLHADKTKLAVEHLSACGNFLRADQDNVYSGFGPYYTGSLHNRTPQPGKLIWTPINPRTDTLSEYKITTLDSVVDLASYGKLTYLLTYSGLEEWDLSSRTRLQTYPTQESDIRFGDEQHPRSMARYKDKLVIAHGRLGVSIFNLTSKKLTSVLKLIPSQYPELESMARAVAVSERFAFVALDSYSLVGPREKAAFRGIVIVDMDSEKVIREIGDLPAGLDSLSADGNVVIASFYGMPLWKYTVQNLLSKKSPQPIKRIFKFAVNGYPTGKALLDEKYYHSCFTQFPEPSASSPDLIRTKTTMNRSQLMLD